MFSRLFLVTIFILASRSNASDNCREMTFVYHIIGKAFKGHELQSFETSSCELCQIKCYIDEMCVSYNCGSNTCDLNSSDHILHPNDLKEDEDRIYCASENACRDHQCRANATCLNGFTDKGYKCKCHPGSTGDYCEKSLYIHVKIRSEGFDDPHVMPSNRARAIIQVDGTDYSRHKRGHNIVAVYPNASIHSTASFDTHGDGNAGTKMRDYINALPSETIVLVATQDSAKKHYHAASNALKSIGARDPLDVGFRSSWYLVGYKGPEPKPWIKQGYAARRKGPSEAELNLILSQ